MFHLEHRLLKNLLTILIISFAIVNNACTTTSGKIKTIAPQDNVLVDRDGNRYPIKKMPDNTWWMTSNLKLNVQDSYCYENAGEKCEQYGRLYTWQSAKRGCRILGEEWQLPAEEAWQQLTAIYGSPGDSIAFRKRAYSALLHDGSAQFHALLGGGRDPDGRYKRLEAHGFYWTATETDSSMAWYYNFGKGSQSLYRQKDGEKSMAISVRCIKKSTKNR